MEQQNQELDLIDVIKICAQWLYKYIIQPVLFLIRFLLKNWKAGLIGIAVGIVWIILSYLLFPKYRSYIVFTNTICSSTDFINELNLLQSTSYEYKASALGISMEQCEMIRQIKPHYVCYNDTTITTYSVDFKDTQITKKENVALSNLFCIETIVSDTSAFRGLKDGYEKYFSSLPYFALQSAQKTKSLQATLDMAQSESKQLNSMRAEGKGDDVVFGISKDGNNLSSLINPATYTNEMMNLNNVANSAANDIVYASSILMEFSPMKIDAKPVNLTTEKMLKRMICALFLAYFIVFCVKYKENIIKLFV